MDRERYEYLKELNKGKCFIRFENIDELAAYHDYEHFQGIYRRDVLLLHNCGFGLGHVVGYHDKSDYDRTNFYQKSSYQRKYHFQNKIEEANTKFNLNLSANDKYKYELYKKLMKINKESIKKN